jgi:glycine/D-amino acid oxidase-like deaminating enzyme
VKATVSFLVALVLFGESPIAFAQTNWQEALARMPLPGGAEPIERENAIRRILQGLQADSIVKAIVVLPAVSDDLYLINRDTNATVIRATFAPPFLLLHRSEDFLAPQFIVKDAAAAERLRTETHLPQAVFLDTHWKKLRPILNKALRPSIHPWASSPDSWHFARHNLTGWNLSDWELLAAVSLSGSTSYKVEKRRVTFRRRSGP